MDRRFIQFGLLLACCALLTAGRGALAQRPADAKIRGVAYYFYTGEIYRGHIGDHAFLLNEYSASGEPVPKEVVQENAAAIRAALTAAQKSYAKAGDSSKKLPTIVAQLKELDKHHSAMLELCGKLDAEAAKPTGDAAKVSAACVGILEHVDGLDAVHAKLAEQLKIPPLDPQAAEPPR